MYGYRTDVGTLQPPKRMGDGRLRADAYITRPGIFEYADSSYPGGVRRELRRRAEVFSQATMDSFAQVPVTNDHPPVMLTANNATQYMVGSTGETVRRADDHIATSIMVADAAAISDMNAGKNEVSCGYGCVIDETPGVDPEFGRYDVEQREIRGNHLAIVAKGRAGRTARVRMDAELTAAERDNLRSSSFAAGDKLPIHDEAHVRAAMSRFAQTDFASADEKSAAVAKICAAANKFGIDSTGFEKKYGGRSDARDPHYRGGGAMADEDSKKDETIRALSAQLQTETARADKAEQALKGTTDRADKADGKVEELGKKVVELQTAIATGASAIESDAVKRERTRADSLQATVNRFDQEVETRVRTRCDVMTKAVAVMGQKFRMDDLSDTQIRRQVLKRMDASIDIGPSVPDAKIEGMFELRVDDWMRNARDTAHAGQILAEVNTEKPRADAREKNREAEANAWKQPLSNDPRARAAGKVS